jgi:hypothetical protein
VTLDSTALSLTRSDKPGQQFEMVAYLFYEQVRVEVFRLGGKLGKRSIAVRQAMKEPPVWADPGDVLRFAGQTWIPEDHSAAVRWMSDLDASVPQSPGEPGSVAEAGLVGAGAPPSARLRLAVVSFWVRVAGAIVGLLSIIGGVFLAVHQDDFDERPYIGAGIGSIVSGIVFWSLAYFAATFAEAWLETTESGNRPQSN